LRDILFLKFIYSFHLKRELIHSSPKQKGISEQNKTNFKSDQNCR
jgi:hypothetical protein